MELWTGMYKSIAKPGITDGHVKGTGKVNHLHLETRRRDIDLVNLTYHYPPESAISRLGSRDAILI